ncbi:hypothetical protein D3C83_38410 [compost metagenome]
MKQFTIMDDGELGKLIIQLRRDVHDFCGRVAHVATALKLEGREHDSDDPLYQRLSSIRDFLQKQLERAEEEAARRALEREKRRRPVTSPGAALWAHFLPRRRVKVSE